MGRIPILACVAIELLAPAKILSKTFQSEDVDLVPAKSLHNQAKKGLKRIRKREFEELPTVIKVSQPVQPLGYVSLNCSFHYLFLLLPHFLLYL